MSTSITAASSIAARASRVARATSRTASPRSARPVSCPSARRGSVRVAAGKFQKIGDAAAAADASDAAAEDDASDAASEAPKLQILGRANDDGTMAYDDDELPDNLFDAVATAAEATEQAISAGSLGNLVELRIPELWDPISGNVMAEAGDQLKVWEITREYVSQLCQRVGPDQRVIFRRANPGQRLPGEIPHPGAVRRQPVLFLCAHRPSLTAGKDLCRSSSHLQNPASAI